MEIIALCSVSLLLNIQGVWTQDDQIGQHIGELNSYHNQVGGDVYAVDEHTILIKGFTYDGNGRDTFFWAGTKPRPGPQGFIVPNEYGRTNVLGPYLNKDITITLPDGKTLNDIRWLAVFDISRLESYGDVYIYEGFEPPQKVIISKMSSKQNHVSSGPITIIDSKTIGINHFKYNGTGKDAYFWVGIGPQASSKGGKIPDEHGYMTPLRRYRGETITLTLPGKLTVFTIDWLAVYDLSTGSIMGSVIIPEELNIPPSLVTIKEHKTDLPNCEQLHKDIQISWEIFGDTVTLEIAAQMDESNYAAFGISSDPTKPNMIGGDVVVVFRDGYLTHVKDYNMTSYFPCSEVVPGQPRGVCEDLKVGGQEDYQIHRQEQKDGIQVFQFRRRVITPDPGDIPYPAKGPAMIIWALGYLDQEKLQPLMHYAWSGSPQPMTFSRLPAENNCFAFTQDKFAKKIEGWPGYQLTNVHNVINATLGPDGGIKGYSSITGQHSDSGLVWYMNGQLSPEIVLQRNVDYKILVHGGRNTYDPAGYHPMMITNEPHGAYSQLTDEQKSKVRVLAGVDYTIGGTPKRSAVGARCIWKHWPHTDRRRDVEYTNYISYRNSLAFDCDTGNGDKPGILRLRPNRTWPNVVYYNSWTGKNMGWKIIVVDDGIRNSFSLTLLLTMLLGITFYNVFVIPV